MFGFGKKGPGRDGGLFGFRGEDEDGESGRGGRVLGPGGGKEDMKEIIYHFRPAEQEHMPGFWNDMGGMGEADGEYFVPGAMDMI